MKKSDPVIFTSGHLATRVFKYPKSVYLMMETEQPLICNQ